MTKTRIKWQFVAHYQDGSTFTQPTDDTSKTDPGMSSFHDVDHSKLAAFSLHHLDNYFKLNLASAEYSTASGNFKLHSGQLTNIQLMYFRRVSQTLSAETQRPIATKIIYILGYQAVNEDGRAVHHYIALS